MSTNNFFKKYFIATTLLLLLLFIINNRQTGPAEEEYQNDNKSGFILGVNGHPLGQQSYLDIPVSRQLDLIKEAGISWYRIDLGGSLSRFPDLIKAAKKKNIILLPIILPPLDINKEKEPEKIRKAAYDYTFKLVNLYKADIKTWEMHNELENFAILKKGEQSLKDRIFQLGAPDGDSSGHYQEERYQKAKAMLDGISRGVHDADPKARRIINSGWLHYGFIENLVNDGVAFEIIGWHWYSDMGNISRVKGYFNLVEKLKTFKKEIWITEGNRIGGSSDGKEAEQAEYLAKIHKQMISLYPDIKAYFIYELLDEPYFAQGEANFGLVQVKYGKDGKLVLGEKKPAFYFIKD
jgi:hypothetical protein